MRTSQTPQEWAAQLDLATKNKQPIKPISTTDPDIDLPFAYAVQSAWREHAISQGRRVVGHKIGLTALSVQQQFDVNQPDSGTIYADTEIPNGETVPINRLIQPRIEAEIAFVLGRDITHQDITTAELLRSIEFILPSFEIVDSRIENWNIKITDTVADNGSAAGYVVGTTPVRLDSLELSLCGMVLKQNNEIVSTGCGAACLGHPLNALKWLVTHKLSLNEPVKAGDIILSGALGPMFSLSPNNLYEASFGRVGNVRCQT